MWINRNRDNNSLIVFLHGLFGDRFDTWRHILDLLQGMTQQSADPLLASYDVFTFSYASPKRLVQHALGDDALPALQTFFDQQRGRYATSILVGHSQGGVLARYFCLEELRKRRGNQLIADLIITLNTPHLGSKLGDVLYPVTWFSDKLRLPVFTQAGNLSRWGDPVKTINKLWREHVPQQEVSADASHRKVRLITYRGLKDWVVSKKSAAGLHSDSVIDVLAGHSINDPYTANRLAVNFRDHKPPNELTRRAKASLKNYDTYFKQYAGLVRDKIQLYDRGAWGDEYVDQKTNIILRDFLDDIRQRPLRCVSFDDALMGYAQRRLSL
jgi:pimeloyl-ACP methyl ester carboxylesterase